MKRILVTGACGFVGTALCGGLRAEFPHADIIGMDNLSRAGSWQNREPLKARNIRIIHGDLRCPSDLESLGAVDWVIDAATNPSVLAGVGAHVNSRQLVEHNLQGTVNTLEYCKRYNAGFIFLSTSRVYSIAPLSTLKVAVEDNRFILDDSNDLAGMTTYGISEEFPVYPPLSLYGNTKLASEQLAIEYGEAFDFPVWINRCGVLAGAGQFGRADQGIYSFWLHSWVEGRPLKYIGFEGLGHQVRDCLHPKDLVPLLVKQMEHGSREPISNPTRFSPRVYNVSGGLESAMSLAQLSQWCGSRWGTKAVMSSNESRPFDLPWVVLDSRRAQQDWNWKPRHTTSEILMEISEFAEKNPRWLDLSI